MSDELRYPGELAMPLGEAMFSQRAIRRLRPDPLPAEALRTILAAAVKAPNGGNAQPWRFLLLRNREQVRAFGELYREAWWAKRRDQYGWRGPEDVPPEAANYRSAMALAEEMKDAPAIVLVFSEPSDLRRLPEVVSASIFPAVQNLMLAARALGVGSTLTMLHPDVTERVFALVGAPPEAHLHCCIPLGYPRGRFGPTHRRPVAEVTYLDSWGQPPDWE